MQLAFSLQLSFNKLQKWSIWRLILLVAAEPGGLCWKRSDRRRPGRGPEAHRELVVLLGLAGEARYLMDGAVHDLRRGTLLWAFSGQAHVLLSDTDDFDMWVFLISDRVLPPGESASMPPLQVPKGGGVLPRRLSDEVTTELGKACRSDPRRTMRSGPANRD